MEEPQVEFVCVRQGSRLRVRITTPGYHHNANCQFPRRIRIEGRRFLAPARCARFDTSRNTYFYRVTPASQISIVADNEPINERDIRIFEDEETMECSICMDAQKTIVLMPCGHYVMCATCADQVMKCPMCRAAITRRVARELIH